MGSDLSLKTGDAFDVFTQAEVEKRERLSAQEWERTARYTVFEDGEEVRRIEAERPVTYWQTTMRYTLTNAKSAPVSIDLTQAGLDRGWWSRDFRIVTEDLPGEQDSMRPAQLGRAGARQWHARVPGHLRHAVLSRVARWLHSETGISLATLLRALSRSRSRAPR